LLLRNDHVESLEEEHCDGAQAASPAVVSKTTARYLFVASLKEEHFDDTQAVSTAVVSTGKTRSHR